MKDCISSWYWKFRLRCTHQWNWLFRTRQSAMFKTRFCFAFADDKRCLLLQVLPRLFGEKLQCWAVDSNIVSNICTSMLWSHTQPNISPPTSWLIFHVDSCSSLAIVTQVVHGLPIALAVSCDISNWYISYLYIYSQYLGGILSYYFSTNVVKMEKL